MKGLSKNKTTGLIPVAWHYLTVYHALPHRGNGFLAANQQLLPGTGFAAAGASARRMMIRPYTLS